MTYAQLKAFHAVALERNFHRAAERLFLTQPAVSIQVRNLERDSGRTLFRRGGHAVDLTEAGRALFAVTSQMFDAEASARQLLSDRDYALGRTLHLGADGPHVALDLIAALQRNAPDIRFRVSMANAEDTWENLLSLKVDAAVMANAKSDRRVLAETISKQSLMALVPAGHDLFGRKRVSLETLAACSLVFREQGSNTQRIVDEAFAARRLQVSAALVMGSREGVREAVVRGLGIGFVFDRELGQDPRCGSVRIAGFKDSNADMLLCLKEQRQSPLVAALFKAAKTMTA